MFFSSFTLIKYNCYTCMSTELCTVCKMGEGDHNHERIERSFSHFPIILSKKNFTATAAVFVVTRSSPNANWLECALLLRHGNPAPC